MHTNSLPQVFLESTCCAPPVPPRTYEQTCVLLLGCWPFALLSGCPSVMVNLIQALETTSKSLDCTDVLSLQYLNFLWNLIGLQVLPQATSSYKETSKTPVTHVAIVI